MFIVHPWKYLASGQEEVTGTTVTNPTEYDAEPIYSISGTGNMDVLINGELIRLQNMTGTIIIDTEKDLVYGSGLGFQNVLTYPFPKLKPGENIFSHSITVQPNWRVRL
jgi:phage-related protein